MIAVCPHIPLPLSVSEAPHLDLTSISTEAELNMLYLSIYLKAGLYVNAKIFCFSVS